MSSSIERSVFDNLQKVAERGSTTDQEAEDIRYAAFALQYIAAIGHAGELKEFVDQANQPLTEAQRAHLKSMGL